MRRLLAAVLLSLAAVASASHMPMKINFQGKLLNPATNEPRNGNFTMTFRLYGALSGGSALYTETQTAVPVSNGVFSVQVGSVTGLTADLFQGASAYLSVQVSPDAAEMSPRQQLNMAAYAFTAAQLTGDDEVGVRAGNAYSTFTSAGNLQLQAGVSASSAVFVNGVRASSGVFTSTGSSQYSLETSSGVLVSGGSLRVGASGGIEVLYGVQAATLTFSSGQTADPASASLGMMYYNTSSGTLKLNSALNGWSHIAAGSFATSVITTHSNAATAAKAAAGTILLTPVYIPAPMVISTMTLRVTTLLGAAGDVGLYSSSGTLVLNGGSSSLTTAATGKAVTPTQSNRFVRPGQYYAAVTWNSATGVIGGTNFNFVGAAPRCGSVLGGGLVLPATINPNAITNLQYCYFVAFSQ